MLIETETLQEWSVCVYDYQFFTSKCEK
jgi:hypothetical protein